MGKDQRNACERYPDDDDAASIAIREAFEADETATYVVVEARGEWFESNIEEMGEEEEAKALESLTKQQACAEAELGRAEREAESTVTTRIIVMMSLAAWWTRKT
jgi:hypothetical protein